MTPLTRARQDHESGVVLIIVACAMVVLLGMLAIAIDASYGFVQNRRAQNASDFAAFAADQELNQSASCNGTNPPPDDGILDAIVADIVQQNDASLGDSWTGTFLKSDGQVAPATFGSPSTFSPTSDPSTIPPVNACGIEINATPTWTPFFAGVLGVHQLGGFASGKVAPKATAGPSFSIVALNKTGPHEILSGGTGQFVVSGDIFLNTAVTNQPWSGSSGGFEWDDAIDAKTNSNLYVYGTIHSNDSVVNGQPLWPLDTCFESGGVLGEGNPPEPPGPTPAYAAGDPAAQGPAQQMTCEGWGAQVTIAYDNIDPTVDQIDDPLLASDAPPNPLNSTTNIACPGSAGTVEFSSVPASDTNAGTGMTTLQPGEYQNPVELTGNTTFADCGNGYPGVYRFDQGLWINPGPGDSVTGTNVVLATEAPYPVAGNVPGSVVNGTFVPTTDSNGNEIGGNGAPCLPSGTLTSAPSGHGTPESETSTSMCGGTTDDGVIAYGDSTYVPDTTMSGTGNNFSLIIGGASGDKVMLTGPTAGAYAGTDGKPGLVLYQDPHTQANYGFDAETGDAADIEIFGVVYNASLADYGGDAPLDYWDGIGGGIPFYAGGTLQTGFGAGWATGDGPAESQGSVKLTGTAIVDDFNTDGATGITIIGQPYTLAGTTNLSLIG
jgi:hypothetical protein